VGIADTTAGNLVESFTSLTPSSGNVTDVADDNTIYIGVANGTETLAANTTNTVLKVEQVGVVSDGTNSLGSFASQTSADGAKPVSVSAMYKDINND
jgi:hypothetical protein